MPNTDDPMVQHLRFTEPETKCKMSWKETLEAMCQYYGTFRGRWHENEFWKATLESVPAMTEQEALDKILQIEREADADLQYWRMMQ